MHACVLLFDGYTGAWNQSLTPTPPVDVQVEPSKSRSSYRLSLLLPSAPHPLHLQMGRANGFLFSGGRGDCACRFVSIPPQQRGPGSHLFPEHSFHGGGANELFLCSFSRVWPKARKQQPLVDPHLSAAANMTQKKSPCTFRLAEIWTKVRGIQIQDGCL